MKLFVSMLSSYLKVGLIGFGGGSALIPVIEHETVRTKGLLSEEAYNGHVIVANITPGTLPVKLAAAGGYHVCGWYGMLAAAAAVSLPGVLATVLAVLALSRMGEGAMRHIEMIAVGIAVFIIYLLVSYIIKVMRQRAGQGRLVPSLAVMAAVVLLTGEQEFYALAGLPFAPVFDLSTVDVLFLAFFLIFFLSGGRSGKKLAAAAGAAALFLLCTARRGIAPPPGMLNAVRLAMLILSVYGLVSSAGPGGAPKENLQRGRRRLWRQLISWTAFLVLTSLPMLALVPGSLGYLGRGMLSSVVSFGGGEAYLTVADGMFVSGGMITRQEFYSQLLPVANALPGPILSKILAGVGVYWGRSLGGAVWAGCITALAGYAASLAATCLVFFLILSLYHRMEGMPVFHALNEWILPIICGLLVSTMLSMISENISVCGKMGAAPLPALLGMGALYGAVSFFRTRYRIHDVLLILLCGFASWCLLSLA